MQENVNVRGFAPFPVRKNYFPNCLSLSKSQYPHIKRPKFKILVKAPAPPTSDL